MASEPEIISAMNQKNFITELSFLKGFLILGSGLIAFYYYQRSFTGHGMDAFSDALLASFLLGLVFGVISIRSWACFSTLFLLGAGKTAVTKIFRTLFATLLFALKVAFILWFFFYWAEGESRRVFSFLLGFTAYLFVGIFLTANALRKTPARALDH